MNLTIQLPHAPEDSALLEHAERSLRFALTRFSSAVADIRLRLVARPTCPRTGGRPSMTLTAR